MNYYAPGYGVWLGIVAVSVDTGFDNFHLRDCQEWLAALEEFIWEVDDKNIC